MSRPEGKGARTARVNPPQVRMTYKEVGAELIAALLWGAKTREELRAVTGIGHDQLIGWIDAMRQSGVIRIIGYRCGTPKFGIQAKPFDLPDEQPLRSHRPHASQQVAA